MLLAAATVVVLAAIVWRFAGLNDESAGPVAAVDPGQAALQRTLERTLEESATGIEAPPMESGPVDGAPTLAVSPARTESPEPGVGTEQLPDGYSLGVYHGAMQRAPRTGVTDPDPSPNPAWLDVGLAHDAILDQATRSGRPFTFAVLRVSPGTDLQALDLSLATLDSQIEGSTGGYVRIRVPAERGRLEAIAEFDGVLGVGAVPPEIKADEAFVLDLLARPASEQVPVYITLMAADVAGEWRQALTELGAVVGDYDQDLRSYTANLPASALAPAMAAGYVMVIEPVPVVTANHA